MPAVGRDLTAELAFLTRALKAPALREAVPRLAKRARQESRTHEEFLAACLPADQGVIGPARLPGISGPD
jgi:hypothetical protein